MHATKLIPHKGDTCIAVFFEKKQELINRFKKIDGAKWGTTCHSLTLHTFWKEEQTCVLSQKCWASTAVKPPKFTPTSAPKVCKTSKVRLMIYNN